MRSPFRCAARCATPLDPQARYRIRVVYAGDSPRRKIRPIFRGLEIHPFITKPFPFKPIESGCPATSHKKGELNLLWHRERGLGGNGPPGLGGLVDEE